MEQTTREAWARILGDVTQCWEAAVIAVRTHGLRIESASTAEASTVAPANNSGAEMVHGKGGATEIAGNASGAMETASDAKSRPSTLLHSISLILLFH